MDYEENAKILKALADPNRLKIADILSCGELCACEILEHFEFTQPTLSHHVKVLTEAGLVNVRKDGLWNYYSLNKTKCNEIVLMLKNIISETGDCICKKIGNKECKQKIGFVNLK
uniref:ArsR/SmtB family transcription factor n=1 Tax=Tepidimicrobium xylanilyticum TaxID=1123352 RepID=UPI0037D9C8BB